MDGEVGEIREEHRDEIREEIRRLTARFFVAVSLYLFTGVCKRAAVFERSDPNPGTETMENEHVALYYWASKFNRMAEISFLIMISQIIISTVVRTRQLRNIRENCDIQMVLGLICVIISFSFLAYLRWFVVA